MGFQILLLRHGATAGNREGRYIGRTDEPLLASSREIFRQMCADGVLPRPERVYASPLRRCRETAEILFPGREILLVPDFVECDFGEFEGKNYAELNGNPAYQAFIDSGGELPFPGGESRAEMEERCVRAFSEILRENQPAGSPVSVHPSICRDGFGDIPETDQFLALVVHGGTILSICHHFFGGDPFSWKVGCGEGVLLTYIE